MSSRIRSDLGTVGERLRGAESSCPRHVLVRRGEVWLPGVLLEWVRAGSGWVGRTAWADAKATLTVGLVPAADLRPVGPHPASSAAPAIS